MEYLMARKYVTAEAVRRGIGVLRCRLVVTLARLVHLVGALARPLAAGTSAVSGGVELVRNLRP